MPDVRACRAGIVVAVLLSACSTPRTGTEASGSQASRTQVSRTQVNVIRVLVENKSVATRCAEEDNVYYTVASADVRSFDVSMHKAHYLDDLAVDATAPDFAGCDMSSDPVFNFTASKRTMFEDDAIRIVVFTYGTFWRPNRVALRIADRVESDLHLIQYWLKRPGKTPYEIAVLSPADGYWRLKTLAPPHLDEVAYGSSFLIGPIVEDGRPVVNLAGVVFDPATRTFRLDFDGGGSAQVRVGDVDAEQASLHVSFDAPVRDRPFAGARSMYVADDNADASQVILDGGAPQPVMIFRQGRATSMRLGRTALSRHNSSAADIGFSGFRR